jgi:hypothetical protein
MLDGPPTCVKTACFRRGAGTGTAGRDEACQAGRLGQRNQRRRGLQPDRRQQQKTCRGCPDYGSAMVCRVEPAGRCLWPDAGPNGGERRQREDCAR